MSFWNEPELPAVQRPRPPREKKGKPSVMVRTLAAIAGSVFAFTACLNVYSSMTDKGGPSDPFMAFAMMLPAGILFRYAVTGVIKAN